MECKDDRNSFILKQAEGGLIAETVVLDSVLSGGGIQWPHYCCVFARIRLPTRYIYSMSVRTFPEHSSKFYFRDTNIEQLNIRSPVLETELLKFRTSIVLLWLSPI